MKNSESYKCYLNSKHNSLKHSTYFNVYDHLFLRFKNKKIIFVEIGVFSGGSLEMWRNFFGKNARIIGIDINPIAKKWEKNGFEIFIGNQSDPVFWKNFINKVGNIDILLDDGGHTFEQQVMTTETILPYINDGGLVVVEDTHTSYMNGFGIKKYSFINYVKVLIDRINARFEDFNLRSVEKRIWSVEIFESIVAFRINKLATEVISKTTSNNGITDEAKDLRYADNSKIEPLNKAFKSLKFYKIPIINKILVLYLNFKISKGFQNPIKKFFKN